MTELFFSTRADTDLAEIWHYIAVDNIVAADHLLETIHETCEMLKTFPALGVERPDIAPRIRSLPVGNYLVLYRKMKKDVKVLRIVHGARHLSNIM